MRFAGAATLLLLLGGAAEAAPKLRLSMTTLGPLNVAQGANGTLESLRLPEAFNAGDGALSLTYTSNVPWLSASSGSPRSCLAFAGGTCTPVQLALNTASLARGLYTGTVTVSDPNALDAPQTISVTVAVGGAFPERIELAVPTTGGSDEKRFVSASRLTLETATDTGGNWLSVTSAFGGSFEFRNTYAVRATLQPGQQEGTYNGRVTVGNSSFAPDNRVIPVVLRVTSQPILTASPERLSFRVLAGSPEQSQTFQVTNRGQGGPPSLAIRTDSLPIGTGGPRVSSMVSGGTGTVTVDARNATPGVYTASALLQEGPGAASVPVDIEVIAAGPPISAFRGAVNIANFQPGEAIGRGAITALFGEQLSSGDPVGTPSVPLPTVLGGTRVLVNGVAAPLYFVSRGQVNFQMPTDVALGEVAIRVERDGQQGNVVSAAVVDAAPRVLQFPGTDFAIAQHPSDLSLAIPARDGVATRAARAGDVLVFYATGLGATDPAVPAGQASPSAEPLARVTTPVRVVFNRGLFQAAQAVTPDFVGLTPGLVGLYQINVRVPEGLPVTDALNVGLELGALPSNQVRIAVR